MYLLWPGEPLPGALRKRQVTLSRAAPPVERRQEPAAPAR